MLPISNMLAGLQMHDNATLPFDVRYSNVPPAVQPLFQRYPSLQNDWHMQGPTLDERGFSWFPDVPEKQDLPPTIEQMKANPIVPGGSPYAPPGWATMYPDITMNPHDQYLRMLQGQLYG